MSLVFNSKTFSADSYAINSVGYIGAAKTSSTYDDLLLSRSAPRPTTTFSGLSRTEAKFTRTLTLTAAKTATGEAKVRVLVEVPVGYAGADVDTLLNDAGALVSSADFKTHVKSQKVTF